MAGAILVPAIVFSTVALTMLLESERDAAHRSVYETAKAISLAVDRELSNAQATLQVLAVSEKLAHGDLEGFHERLSRNPRVTESWTLVYDAEGRAVVNSGVPWGTALPLRSRPEDTARVLGQKRAIVSDVFTGALSRRQVVAIDVPVPATAYGGPYVLSQAFVPAHFNRLLTQTRPPPSWLIGLFDSKGVSIARTHRHEEFVGHPVRPELYEASRGKLIGELRHVSREGIDVFTVFARSPDSGWTVAVGVPAHELDAPAFRAVAFAATGLVATLAIGIGLALLNGRRLARAIRGAARAAGLIGREAAMPERPLHIDEIDALHGAMRAAHADLMHEKEARQAAEADRAALYAREQEARAAAEAQNKSKDDFLAMLGHELRNPLSAITGAVEVIKRRGGDPQATAHAHSVIERQSGHLAHIVDDLLDVSRVINGKIRLDRHPMDLSAKVRRVLAMLETAGRTGRHTIHVQTEEAWIDADITRIDQVVTNLLVNAFKYTPEGGTVDVSVRLEGGEAVLSVRDDGVGIDAALLPRVFDIFVQGTPAIDRAQGGLGIGLALVRQLMDLHGATITARSDGPGKGSEFVARFPAIEPPVQEAPAEAPPPAALRVLVVEDHADARETLRDLLQLTGHECRTARDGPDGLREAAAWQPDVAIVDIGLPGLSGYEVAQRLRADPATAGIRLIALTGYGQEQDRQQALEAGFDTHLVKPINTTRLFRTLESFASGG
jgi:signal transduction histidine kinase/CheY-like chemotaxis protein